jgi:hypothetical protein
LKMMSFHSAEVWAGSSLVVQHPHIGEMHADVQQQCSTVLFLCQAAAHIGWCV